MMSFSGRLLSEKLDASVGLLHCARVPLRLAASLLFQKVPDFPLLPMPNE